MYFVFLSPSSIFLVSESPTMISASSNQTSFTPCDSSRAFKIAYKGLVCGGMTKEYAVVGHLRNRGKGEAKRTSDEEIHAFLILWRGQ